MSFAFSRIFRGHHASYAYLAGTVAIMVLLAYAMGRAFFGMRFLDLFQTVSRPQNVAAWFLIPFCWLGLVTARLLRRRSDHPTRTLVRWMRIRSDWLIRGLIVIAVYPLTVLSFSVLKSSIPKLTGYFADPYLIKIDQMIFGQDAWAYFHAVAPYEFLFFIDRFYLLWYTYLALMTAIFSFTRNASLQIRSALTFFACWLLIGFVMASALASVGPVFVDQTYGGDHFRPLVETLKLADQERGVVALKAMQFLLTDIDQAKLGGGISAMPSMHVSMAYLGYLISVQLGYLWLRLFTGAFTLLTYLGSFYLGWHYFTDGIVAIILTWVIWKLAGRLVDRNFHHSLRRGGGMSHSRGQTALNTAPR